MSSETLTDFQIYHTPSKVPGKKGTPLAFISETLDFSQFNPYILDLSSLSQQGIELEVQTIEIDNTNNPNQVDVVYSREIQLVRQFPASIIQAYTVPGVINPKQIIITNAQNTGTIRIYLYGYPLPDSASINISGSSGTLQTIATNTGETVSNLPNISNADGNNPSDGLFTFSNPVKYTGTGFERQRLSRTPWNGSGITATTGNILAVGNRLWNAKFWLSGDVIQATGGDNLIQLLDGAVVVGQCKPYVPSASLGTIEKLIMELNFPDGYVVANGLTLSLASDLTGGNLYYNGSIGAA